MRDGTYGTGSGPSVKASLIRTIITKVTDRREALSP
jgi:hypothetical protein